MTDQVNPVSRPWRRFLRFSVRGMIVLVLVTGVWLGWIVRSARIQREAVAGIQNARGRVAYDWQWKGGRLTNGKPWGPEWLVDTIGLDYFGRVTADWTNYFSEDLLVHVGKLGQVQNLIIGESEEMTDGCLAHLKGLTNLVELHLSSSHVTDAGMVHLKGLTGLKELDLISTRITDRGVVHLAGLTKLAKLDLSYTHVTDAGLVYLKSLTELSELSLVPDIASDTELAQVEERDATEWSPYHRQVTDDGLRHLKGLINLSKLNLMGTRVTDAGLVHLKGLTKLAFLNVQHTNVTDAGVQDLQQDLPNLTIKR